MNLIECFAALPESEWSIRSADQEGTFWLKVTDYIMIYLWWDGKKGKAKPDTMGWGESG